MDLKIVAPLDRLLSIHLRALRSRADLRSQAGDAHQRESPRLELRVRRRGPADRFAICVSCIVANPTRSADEIVCTHLTAGLSHVPYPGRGSWLEEQTWQIDELLAFIDRKALGTTPIVVVGDLNCGPVAGGGSRFNAREPERCHGTRGQGRTAAARILEEQDVDGALRGERASDRRSARPRASGTHDRGTHDRVFFVAFGRMLDSRLGGAIS